MTKIIKESERSKQDLLKKARKKFLSNKLAISLATCRKAGSLKLSYWNSYHCSDILTVENGKSKAYYCKNRWCLTCQSIKVAALINGYAPQLNKLNDKYFVTLTAPTVPIEYLKDRVTDFQNKWRKITDTARKKKIQFKGLRKCECTVRPGEQYHYHYHIIIESKESAIWLMDQWLRLNDNARKLAQDLRPADDSSTIELFKYFTKLTTKLNGERVAIASDRLALIFEVLKGHRIYQPFGGLKKINEDYEPESTNIATADGVYKWYKQDWISEDGELLTGYMPTERDKQLY